ncbi:MAG: polysaccharide biosynthesis/export family protein [Chromatiales bacterium]|jgi:polysaccharide export outer membrane protein
MAVAFNLLSGCRGAAIVCLKVSLLSACAIAPGSYFGDRDESVVSVPLQQGEKLVSTKVGVKKITAELIIDMFNSARLLRPGAGGRAPQKLAKPPRVGIVVNTPNYKLGPGDIISIIVWDHPELTTPAGTFRSAEQAGTVIAEDGTIYYPYVGIVRVAGLTTREVRDILTFKLMKFIENVQLDVRVAQFRSKYVYVVGEVHQPGQQTITDIPMTILEAVNRAGGFTEDADFSRVLLTRHGATYRVDIQMMYERGATEQNALLESGDIVNVLDRSFNKVFVLGEVKSPGSLIMNKGRLTLAEALADAGFIKQDSANPRWIYVMRGDGDRPELFHLDAQSPDALLLADRFPLKPRDIVYVDVADIVRWNRVIANILPTANMLNSTSGVRYPLFGGRQ